MHSAFAAAAQRGPSGELEGSDQGENQRGVAQRDGSGVLRSGSVEKSMPSIERQRWQKAITQISRASSFSRSFKTLRNMSGEGYIEERRLKCIKQIGTGAFATVHLYALLAENPEERPMRVAVKRIHPHLLREQPELEAFAAEAKLLRKLQHPNIARFIGVSGESDKVPMPRSGLRDLSNEQSCGLVARQRSQYDLVPVPRQFSQYDLVPASRQRSQNTSRNLEHMMRQYSQPVSEDGSGLSGHSEGRGLDGKLQLNTIIVQEYLNGGSLKKMVLRQMSGSRAYTDAEALVWVRQVAEGLLYLHSANPCVIHRDLKLENIVMRRLSDGRRQACLCDFGLSALVQLQDKAIKRCQMLDSARDSAADEMLKQLSLDVDARLSSYDTSKKKEPPAQEGSKYGAQKFELTGRTGSFFYMAPETVLTKPYNEKVDIFAFGMVMYEIFSRVITSTIVVGPTLDPRAAEVYALKVARGYRRALPPKWPAPMRALIEECWAERPDQRPTAEECVRRLRDMQAAQVFGEEPVPAKQGKHAARGRGCGCGCTVM